MERESFEDEDVASLLNQYFIAIKVDREERPDIDHLYMDFCQALTGSGGWPLTILMTPEKKPFFAGTYFPKSRRYGRAGLLDILHQIGTLWEKDEKHLRDSAEEIVKDVLNQYKHAEAKINQIKFAANRDGVSISDWGPEILKTAYQQLKNSFDSAYGGFGHAPKFPSPHTLGFLLRYARANPESEAQKMVRKTLDSMALGGIYDHIGFGFARYSTDEKWLIPHFEKMLYDNALMAIAYLESYQVWHQKRDLELAKEIFTYILRDMTSPEGGFFSAEDADSEGIEGKFYVWTPQEVKEVLGDKEGKMFCEVYDITTSGNFENKNIPNLIGQKVQITIADSDFWELRQTTENARRKLFTEREKRIHPHKDDKILTSWNALMIVALAKYAQITGEPDSLYGKAAEKALEFIFKNLVRPSDGRLLARYRAGEGAYLGYLDDYAFLIWGLIEIYSLTGKAYYLEKALALQEEQERLFADKENGGYFLTGSDSEELLFRPKEIYDGAQPSGNSVSALNLLRLTRMTADNQWEILAQRQLNLFRSTLSQYPSGYTAFLQAIQFALQPSSEIILTGSLDKPQLYKMRRAIFSNFLPYATLLYQEGTVHKIIPWLNDYPVKEEKTLAYICQQPVDTVQALMEQINRSPL